MLQWRNLFWFDPMRLNFANGEHGEVVVTAGGVTLGSANGNDIVLDRGDVAPWHARIAVDSRGIVLQVLDPAAHTHVNARPVREKALLRLGDTVHLGQAALSIKADSESVDTSLQRSGGLIPARGACVVLRGASGPLAGKAIAVGARAVIGSDPASDVRIDDVRLAPLHATIEVAGHDIWLRSLGPGRGATLNGVAVLDARLKPGDQLVFARQRFVLEAPGMIADASPQQSMAASPGAETSAGEPAAEPDDPASSSAIGWLVGGAAFIASAIYLLIEYGH